jgi:hypothetical protein
LSALGRLSVMQPTTPVTSISISGHRVVIVASPEGPSWSGLLQACQACQCLAWNHYRQNVRAQALRWPEPWGFGKLAHHGSGGVAERSPTDPCRIHALPCRAAPPSSIRRALGVIGQTVNRSGA